MASSGSAWSLPPADDFYPHEDLELSQSAFDHQEQVEFIHTQEIIRALEDRHDAVDRFDAAFLKTLHIKL